MTSPAPDIPAISAPPPRKTPKWMIWTAIGAVLGVAVVLSERMRDSTPLRSRGEPTKPMTLTPAKQDQEVWVGQALGELKSLRSELDKLSRRQEEFEKARGRETPPLGLPPSGSLAGVSPAPSLRLVPPGGQLPPGSPPPMRVVPLPPPASPPAPAGPLPPSLGGPIPLPSNPTLNTMGAQEGGRPDGLPAGPPSLKPLTMPAGKVGGGPGGSGGGGAEQAGRGAPSAASGPASGRRIRVVEPDERAEEKPGRFWIPTGTVIPVQLLSGLDAPTRLGMNANSAYPVLMRVNDFAYLPNKLRLNLRDCYALGEGVGELSAERAMVRILGISCVNRQGAAVEIPIKGVVTGEDGKLGLRGRVITKEGAMLFRSLLAGFVSGIARAFQPFQQGFFVAPSASQALQMPPPTQVGLAGTAGGMQSAAQVLAQHYAMLARQIFPVIEVDAGRKADMIVTEGRELKAPPI